MPDCGHGQIILKLQERVEKLEAAHEKVTKQSAEQQKLITRLQAAITDQQRRLSFYENSNSPPSRDSLEWRQEKKREPEETGQWFRTRRRSKHPGNVQAIQAGILR